MSKFRIGDVVVINGYVHDRGEYYSFVPEMDKFIGKKAKVRWHNENGELRRVDWRVFLHKVKYFNKGDTIPQEQG